MYILIFKDMRDLKLFMLILDFSLLIRILFQDIFIWLGLKFGMMMNAKIVKARLYFRGNSWMEKCSKLKLFRLEFS